MRSFFVRDGRLDSFVAVGARYVVRGRLEIRKDNERTDRIVSLNNAVAEVR